MTTIERARGPRARDRRRTPSVTLGLCGTIASVSAGAGAAPRAGFTHAPADAALVERVLRDSQVARELPQPSLADYLGHLSERLAQALGQAVARGAEALRASGLDPRVVAWAIVVLAALALAWALVAALLRRRRSAVRPAPVVVTRGAPVDDGARLLERDAWRRELEARLARGDPAAALEALWWWFARSLSGAAVERSWTSRELLARAGRLELSALASSLDRLLYGPERPRVETVRRLAERLQAVLR